MYLARFAFLIFTLIADTAEGSRCYSQFHTSISTLVIEEIPLSQCGSSAECCDRCAAKPDCVAWIWHAGANTGIAMTGCQLKGSTTGPVPSEYFIAGYHPNYAPYADEAKKYAVDHEHVYTTVTRVGTANVLDWKGCMNVCSSTSVCKYWSFKGNTCELKSSNAGRTVDTTYTSGATINRCHNYTLISGQRLTYQNAIITLTEVGSIEECGKECFNLYECRAFMYNEQDQNCHLTDRTTTTTKPMITVADPNPQLHLYIVT